MKFTHKIASVLTVALSMNFVHCGSSGTNTPLGFGSTALTGMYVVSSSPSHNAYYVSATTKTITIRMSEAVNQSTAKSNVQIIQNPDNNETNLTGRYNIDANGQVITLEGRSNDIDGDGKYDKPGEYSGELASGSNYQIRLTPALAAVSGNTLLQGQSFQFFYIDFSTGSGGSNGQGQPGAPKVVNAGKNSFDCSVVVTFNESIQYPPLMQFHSWNLGPVVVPADVYPAQSGNTSQWVAVMPAGYSPLAFDLKVTDYVDNEGNHGEPWLSRKIYCF